MGYAELKVRVIRDGVSSLANAERVEYYRLLQLGGEPVQEVVMPVEPEPEESTDGTE